MRATVFVLAAVGDRLRAGGATRLVQPRLYLLHGSVGFALLDAISPAHRRPALPLGGAGGVGQVLRRHVGFE